MVISFFKSIIFLRLYQDQETEKVFNVKIDIFHLKCFRILRPPFNLVSFTGQSNNKYKVYNSVESTKFQVTYFYLMEIKNKLTDGFSFLLIMLLPDVENAGRSLIPGCEKRPPDMDLNRRSCLGCDEDLNNGFAF